MDLDIPSVYKILQQQLNAKDEKHFVHELIYIIEFSRRKGTLESVMHEFHSIIRSQKNFNSEEVISGVLLLKENYGIHVFEGSDCTIVKHLKNLSKLSNRGSSLVTKSKIASLETHVEKRLNHKWKCIDLTAISNSNADSSARRRKSDENTKMEDPPESNPNGEEKGFDEIYDEFFSSLHQIKSILVQKASVLIKLRQHSEQYEDVALILETISDLFPVENDMKMLMSSNQLEDLQTLLQKLLKPPATNFFYESVWPVPSINIPLYFDVTEFENMRD